MPHSHIILCVYYIWHVCLCVGKRGLMNFIWRYQRGNASNVRQIMSCYGFLNLCLGTISETYI